MVGGGRGLTDRRHSQWSGRVRLAGGDWRARTRAGGRGAERYWLCWLRLGGGGLGCRWLGGPGEPPRSRHVTWPGGFLRPARVLLSRVLWPQRAAVLVSAAPGHGR